MRVELGGPRSDDTFSPTVPLPRESKSTTLLFGVMLAASEFQRPVVVSNADVTFGPAIADESYSPRCPDVFVSSGSHLSSLKISKTSKASAEMNEALARVATKLSEGELDLDADARNLIYSHRRELYVRG